MHDDTPEARFSKCWSEAMFGYAHAASAAYWEMTNRSLALWGDAARSMAEAGRPPEPSPRSWYRPPGPDRSALLSHDSPARDAWGFPRYDRNYMGTRAPFASLTPELPSPFSVWFSMFPLRGSPTCWPMAFAMIASGVPQAVAWPAAEANAALLDAARAAQDSLSGSRSSGHYAVPRAANPMAFDMMAMWQWPFYRS